VDGEGQTVPDEIDLGSLAAAYDLGDGLSGSGIAGRGWAWRHQRRGASDEHTAGAVLVPITSTGQNADWRLWSRRSVITITWDSETARPTGYSLSQTSPVEWVPDGATLWAQYTESEGQASVCLDMSMRRPATCTYRVAVTAYWCAWYSQGGAVVDCTIETAGSAASGNSGPSITSQISAGTIPQPCPGSQSTATYHAWTSAQTETVAVGAASSPPRIAGTWRDDEVLYAASGLTWVAGVGGEYPGTYGSPQCAQVVIGAPPPGQQNAQYYEGGYSQMTVTARYATATIISSGRVIVMPPDCECAWLCAATSLGSASWSGSIDKYGSRLLGKKYRWYPSMTSIGTAITAHPAPPGGTPVSSSLLPSEIADRYPPARVWYVGSDGAAHQIADAQAAAWLTALGALGLSVPCTDQVPAASAQSAGGRVLATGVDDGGLSAAGAVTAGRWVGGV
jgi:hypothetical protein